MKNRKAHLKEILSIVLPKYCKGSAVDVGAGYGKYSGMIREYADSYTSVDNMSSEYQYGDEYRKPDVVSDVLHMPIADSTYDTVICTEVLEHIEDPFQLFSEIARIVKPGGYALVSSGWIAPHHEEPKDYWRFSIDAYRVLCKRSGLEFVESYKKGGFFTVMLYFVHRNITLDSANPHATHYIWSRVNKILEVIAEKLDTFVRTEDTIGHLIVARKPT